MGVLLLPRSIKFIMASHSRHFLYFMAMLLNSTLTWNVKRLASDHPVYQEVMSSLTVFMYLSALFYFIDEGPIMYIW